MEHAARLRRPGATVAAALLAALPQLAAAAIGRTPGFADVSADGEAAYSVPIALPPGTNGLTPVLSLDYRHRTRGGPLGVGWSIGGLSQVTRCARTVAQDGVAAAPRRDAGDRFCLDGQRLVFAGGVAYGAPGAEYRTELESFARIRSAGGNATSGPAHFVVETADGRVLEYGATNDSRIDGTPGPSTTAARAWALNRVSDRAGNVIDYRYTEEQGSLAWRLAAVSYGANPALGVAAAYELRFRYERRPNDEVDAGYVAGMPVREVMRLASIELRSAGAVVRRFELAYEPILAAGGRSRLAHIRECAGTGTDCLTATRFTWSDGAPGLGTPVAFAAQIPGPAAAAVTGSAWNLLDLDGDGRDDAVWAGGADLASATIRFRLSRAGGGFGPAVNTGLPAPRSIGAPFDADGDRRTDLLLIAAGANFAIAHGGAAGLGPPVDTGVAKPATLRDFRGADLNGDGLGDIAWSEVPDPAVSSLRVRAAFARAGGGYAAPVTLYVQFDALGYLQAEGGDFLGRPGQRIDLDGDGAEELLMNENDTIARIGAFAHGTEFFDARPAGAIVLDFNGDDCSDLAWVHVPSNSIRIRTSECVIAGTRVDLQGPAWAGYADLSAMDWNADGRDDLLVRDATRWRIAVSQGDSAAPFADTGVAEDGVPAIAGRDADGDGLQDLAVLAEGQLRVRMRGGPVPDLLESATDGFGTRASFRYAALTEAGLYARGPAAAWPEPDRQTPETVVAGLETSDGSGGDGVSTAQFRYEGLRHNLQGRGSLGFRRLVRTDESGGVRMSVETTRRQDFPFTRRVESVAVRGPAGEPIADVETVWTRRDLGGPAGSRRFVWPARSTTRHFEIEGPLAGSEITRTVTTVATVDADSGLATDTTTVTTETAGGANPGASASLRVLHTAVLNDTANWCLGRSQAVEVTASHTLAGGAARQRDADQAWDGLHCRPTRVRLLPGSGATQLTYAYTYDGFGNLATEKVSGAGLAARTVRTDWGAAGRYPVRVTDPLGQALRFAWDARSGQPTSLTAPDGLVTRWAYDGFGRVQSETAPDGTATRWTRETCGSACDPRAQYRLREEDLDAAGVVRAVTNREADRFERAVRIESRAPGGGRSVVSREFGARGELLRSDLPHWDGGPPPGHRSYAYDAAGRPAGEALVDAGGAVKRVTTLRHEGLAMTMTDALGRARTETRLAWGPLAEIRDAAGGRTRYEHDAFGALARVVDAAGNEVVSMTRDARGFRTALDDMDRGSWRWTLNALGETTALRDARGQTTAFEYDLLGRLTRRSAPDGVATWTWGRSAARRETGRLVALAGTGYAERIAYDPAGRPAAHTVTTDADYRFDFSYNALGLLDTLTYPAAGPGAPFRIRHDYESGRLVGIDDATTAGRVLWRLNAADAAGHPLDESFGAAVRVISGHAPAGGEIEYRQAFGAGGSVAQDLAYRWDAAGNLAAREDLGRNLVEDFAYDGLDRLVRTRRNGATTLTLDYDAIGNIWRKSDVCSGTLSCYAYHATRRHAVVAAGGRTYAYDANGNMTSRNGAPIAWDSGNRPVSIAHANGRLSQFAYGPDGNRWRQVATGGPTAETTLYVGGLFEKTIRGGATTWRHYVEAPGGTVVALRFGDGTPAADRFVVHDHLGSTDRVFDEAGRLLASASFGPFGERRGTDWTGLPTAAELAQLAAATPDGFTGHEQLDPLQLVHMNGRVYDPALGRFLSADPYVTRPLEGQGLNRYAYVLNNPLAFADPSGFDAVPCATSPEGRCVQITVIGATWTDYVRAVGGAHAAEIASALERDPCGQNGSALACAMQTDRLVPASSILLSVGTRPDPRLHGGGALDAAQGLAARVANLAIGTSPIALLFGADPDFEYFQVPDSQAGRLGALVGSAASLAAGFGGILRRGGQEVATRASTAARSYQGTPKYPMIDRFRDITLKKGTIVYAGFPGQSAFYTTASALRRAGGSAEALWKGLQVARHEIHPQRTRMAAYEVLEDAPAAFGRALANGMNGAGGYPQIVVPSYRESLRYLHDFALAP